MAVATKKKLFVTSSTLATVGADKVLENKHEMSDLRSEKEKDDDFQLPKKWCMKLWAPKKRQDTLLKYYP